VHCTAPQTGGKAFPIIIIIMIIMIIMIRIIMFAVAFLNTFDSD